MSWFWCLNHKTVEEGFGCGTTSRLGPYATQAEAATALERVRKRKQEEDALEEERDSWGTKRK